LELLLTTVLHAVCHINHETGEIGPCSAKPMGYSTRALAISAATTRHPTIQTNNHTTTQTSPEAREQAT